MIGLFSFDFDCRSGEQLARTMTKALRNKIKDPGIINFRQLPTSVVSRCFLQHLLFDVCRIDSRNVRRSARFPRRGALQIEANRIQQNQEDPNLIFIFFEAQILWFMVC